MLQVREVTVGYLQDIFVLQDLSLDARPRQVTAVVGPNGAGKSTLLKTIYGFLKPRRGGIFIDGQEISGLKPFELPRRGLAYVMQEIAVLPHMTVEENLGLGAWLFRHDRTKVRQAIGAVYDRYPQLGERRQVRAGRLSGGEQRMLEIGRALMNDPRVMLLDEPSAGLAPSAMKEIYQIIESLKNEGRIIVLVEQNVRQALSITDMVYVLELGRVKFAGPKASLNVEKTLLPWLKP